MREVRVHLECVVIPVLQRPFETGDVSGPKSLFATSLDEKQPLGEFFLQSFDNYCSTVRRTVVDDQDVITALERENLAYDIVNVFLLVVGRYYYYFLVFHLHYSF